VVYEYFLTPLIFFPYLETFSIDHIIINYPLLECGIGYIIVYVLEVVV